jgi:molybdopterin converting factor small subunit
MSQINNMHDVLNAIIREALDPDPESEMDQMEVQKDREMLIDIDLATDPLAYVHFAEKIDEISYRTIEAVFEAIEAGIENFLQRILRGFGPNLWKAIHFFLVCIEHLDVEKEEFDKVCETLKAFCDKLLTKEKDKFVVFFENMVLEKLVEIIRGADTHQKREAVVPILYYFFPPEPTAYHQAIKLFKERLNNMEIFVQSLCTLIMTEQTETDANRNLIKDFKFYAKLAIKDKKPTIRLSGLLLMHRLTKLDSDWVQKVMIRYFDCVSPDDYWENRIMVVVVYTTLLQKLTQTELYQVHVKMVPSDLPKAVTVENEMLIKVMKEVIDQMAVVIGKVLKKNLNPDLLRISMIHLIDVIGDSKVLVGIFLELLLKSSPEDRRWVLEDGRDPDGFEERYIVSTRNSIRYRCSLDMKALQSSSLDILSEMAVRVRSIPPGSFRSNYLDVLSFCMNTEGENLEKLNIEVFDSLINNSLDHILHGMTDPELVEACSDILEKYTRYYLREDVLIQDLEKRLGETFIEIFTQDDDLVKEESQMFLERLKKEYTADKPVYERFCKMCSKICMVANSKSIPNEYGEYLERELGFEGASIGHIQED